jgi:type VI secretion system VasD/TssJ family lipoprotein
MDKRRLLFVWAALALGGACAHAPCEEFAPISVRLTGSKRLNPNPDGQPLPTFVRVLQVKSAAKLEHLDLTDVWDKEKELLAEDLISSVELSVNPGKDTVTELTPSRDAKELVVVALFQRPVGDEWRLRKPLPKLAERRCLNVKTPEPVPPFQVLLDESRVEDLR